MFFFTQMTAYEMLISDWSSDVCSSDLRPMAFSPVFLDDLRNRLTLSAVVGRRVKLVKRGREHSGLCPFHNEKTPSFTVSDDKGFYHCFGCGAHGSAIDFVMNSEGLRFPETVERLAGLAGLQVPPARSGARGRAQIGK